MRHANLFLAAATVLFGSAAALWADPVPAPNSTEISRRDAGPSVTAVPADSTPAPTVAPPSSPVAGIAADPGMKGAPQEAKSDPIPHAVHAVVPPRRPVTHLARPGCFSSHHSARAAKLAVRPRGAAPRATVWLAAAREPQCSSSLCSKFVLLGAGY
jgi:hypothetical protein